MGAGDYNVAFVDQVNRVIYETITSGVPRVGDHIDLPLQQIAGEVDLVTWQVAASDASSRVFVRIKPHARATDTMES
jgi:hypothetical protein